MTQQNFISLEIPEEELAEIRAAISLLQEKLEPYLESLSPEERRELPKMGDKSLAFVQKALEYCNQNTELVPAYLDVAEFERDLLTVTRLREFYQPLLQLVERLEDSQMLAGSDAYQAALIYYSSVKAAMKSRTTSSYTIYEDLASRFPARNRKKEAETRD